MTPETAAAILNVAADADRGTVTRAYSLRARMTHPDRFAGAPQRDVDVATAEFVRVSNARDVLVSLIDARERDGAGRAGHASAAADDAKRRSRPVSPPIPFEQFVIWREQSAWKGATSGSPQSTSGPPTTPAPTASTGTAPAKTTSLKVLWWSLGAGLAAVLVIGLGAAVAYNAAQDSSDQQSNGTEPVTTLDAGNGATVSVDSSPDGWEWTLTSDSDCPAARVTVNFEDSEDGPSIESYSDTASLVAEVPYTFTVPDGTSARAYASLDDVFCQ